MAEAAVEFAIKTLGSLLVQEVKLLGSAKKEVESIKSELESMRSCLTNADATAAAEEEGEGDECVKTWVKQLREEAYNIEDVLDEYILKKAQLPYGSGFFGVLRKISRFIKKLKLRHEVATAIQDIKSSLDDIKRRRQIYNFKDEGSSSGTGAIIPHDSRVGSFFIEDSEIVGIESSKHKLIDLLMNQRSSLSVIAMVGEGGLGKTTLAAKIYDNDVVKKHFDCQALIIVEKEYMKKDLLKTIKQQFNRQTGYASGEIEAMEETNEMNLMTALRKLLKDKCYMVLFDDVWNIEFWEDVKYALLDNNRGSRVMLTTRNMTVAHSIPFVNVHMLEPLPLDKAWELFRRKAFGFNVSCPPELEKLSHEIIAKCGGLPLTIVAVGGLLSNKNKVVSEWKKLLDGLGSRLGSDPHLRSCNRVLSEGYYDLPHNLKSCLLYFAVFPESYEIKFGRLIRLWIGEGFVQHRKSFPVEQVAEDYLKELID
ncbi:putative disease resistance RPP13-like protein 3 [Pistacia vera]|uniref:putative disease resistance RPP13-like protein 3 n=1 Tax=Pistacia vera TaxID=55513 RepID=UPI001262B2BD|nr:putative disease resistance RPP13-like protein 3 [Pistacia vera]